MNKRILYLILVLILLITSINLSSFISEKKVLNFCEEYYTYLIDGELEIAYEYLYHGEDESNKQLIEEIYNFLEITNYEITDLTMLKKNLYQVTVNLEGIYEEDKVLSDYVVRFVFIDSNGNYRIALNHTYLPEDLIEGLEFETLE